MGGLTLLKAPGIAFTTRGEEAAEYTPSEAPAHRFRDRETPAEELSVSVIFFAPHLDPSPTSPLAIAHVSVLLPGIGPLLIRGIMLHYGDRAGAFCVQMPYLNLSRETQGGYAGALAAACSDRDRKRLRPVQPPWIITDRITRALADAWEHQRFTHDSRPESGDH
jgi:hypothetical protein